MTTFLLTLFALFIGALIGATGMALLAAGQHDELQREIDALRFRRKPIRGEK
jgi:hypothetical protein